MVEGCSIWSLRLFEKRLLPLNWRLRRRTVVDAEAEWKTKAEVKAEATGEPRTVRGYDAIEIKSWAVIEGTVVWSAESRPSQGRGVVGKLQQELPLTQEAAAGCVKVSGGAKRGSFEAAVVEALSQGR